LCFDQTNRNENISEAPKTFSFCELLLKVCEVLFMVEIYAIGGYNEVGKNMTAVRVGNEIIILDMGLHLPNYINFTKDEDITFADAKELIAAGAIPDESFLHQWKDQVKAIIPTHAHLDHVGAIPYLASNYDCPIICTPFTAEVIKAITKDEKIKLKNPIKILNANSSLQVSENFKIEFIYATHSTPQTVMVALHTEDGIVLYCNDFKFDNFPTIGSKPNYKRLIELGKENVVALIVDSLYCEEARKMPSEIIAREMLKDVLIGTDSKGKAVIVTTFSSHLARLKSIIECGKKMKRKIVFLGRSLSKYITAGENVGLIDFSKDAEIVKFSKQIKKKLAAIEKDGVDKYLLVITGHQGEPKATLSKMVDGELPFKFRNGDHIIFSCNVIPTPTNVELRRILEDKLKKFGVRMFKGVHVSGHAAKEDIRELVQFVKPKHIIPAHSESGPSNALVELVTEMGFKKGENVHVIENGKSLSF